MKSPKLLTTKEVGEILRLEVSSVMTNLRSGILKGFKLNGKAWRIEASDLREFIERNYTEADIERQKIRMERLSE